MTTIPALTQNAILTNKDGTFTPQFKLYLDEILNRVGGINGGTYTALTNTAGVIFWDLNQAPVAVVVLQNGVNTLSPPVNMVAGAPFYRLTLVQPATGAPGTITWPKPPFVFPGGVLPTLSTGNGAVDEVAFDPDGINMKLVIQGLNYS